jgi:hypothetical protein
MPKITKQTMKPQGKTKEAQDAWDFTDHVSVLLFGASGTGKTTFWATFPAPILAVICSSGEANPEELLSIDDPEGKNRQRITAKVCSTGEQVSQQIELAANGKYKTFVLDHGTGLNLALLREELGVEELLQKPAYSGAAARQAYGAAALRMKEILYRVLSLSCNRVIVGQEKDHARDGDIEEEKSELLEDMQVASIGADFSKSIIKWVNPACSFLVQTFKRPKMVEQKIVIGGKTKTKIVRGKGVDYCLRVGPHDRVITKFRKTKEIILPDVIVDPNFDKMMALVKGKQV